MMSLVDALDHPEAQRLALTLLHFLWQGFLVAGLLALLLSLGRFRRAETRYAIHLTALVLLAVCPPVTYLLIDAPILHLAKRDHRRATVADLPQPTPLSPPFIRGEAKIVPLAKGDHRGSTAADLPQPTPLSPPFARGEAGAPAESSPEQTSARHRLRGIIAPLQPYIVLVWLAGVTLCSARLLIGLAGLSWIKRRADPVPDWVVEAASRVGCRLGVSETLRVAACPAARDAMAVGLLRPMVLLPAAWVTRLPPDVLEAVLAHELGHIRRWDVWVNLLQRLAETLLFYHPAVWWISGRLRSEREFCCDALAASAVGERTAYAKALEFVAQHQFVEGRSVLAPGMRGGRKMALLNRIRNVLGMNVQETRSGWWSAGILALAVPLALWAATAPVPPAEADEPREETAERDREDREGDRDRSREEREEADEHRRDRRERDRERDRAHRDRHRGDRDDDRADRDRRDGDRRLRNYTGGRRERELSPETRERVRDVLEQLRELPPEARVRVARELMEMQRRERFEGARSDADESMMDLPMRSGMRRSPRPDLALPPAGAGRRHGERRDRDASVSELRELVLDLRREVEQLRHEVRGREERGEDRERREREYKDMSRKLDEQHRRGVRGPEELREERDRLQREHDQLRRGEQQLFRKFDQLRREALELRERQRRETSEGDVGAVQPGNRDLPAAQSGGRTSGDVARSLPAGEAQVSGETAVSSPAQHADEDRPAEAAPPRSNAAEAPSEAPQAEEP